MKPTILIAEDNEEALFLYSFVLERAGCEVLKAEDGLKALEVVATRVPDLIVMDIQMPVMDGIDAVERMRADPRLAKVPIIALSAHAMIGDRENALGAGFTGYLEKPVEIDSLLKGLAAFLPTLKTTL